MTPVQMWALGGGEVFLLVGFIIAKVRYWEGTAVAWWLVSALSLAGCVLFGGLPRELWWAIMLLTVVSGGGLWAMALDLAGYPRGH
jgi:hypothetical protein